MKGYTARGKLSSVKMFRLRSEFVLGDITGAPVHMRNSLKSMSQDGFLSMLLTKKPTKNPNANYFFICLFEKGDGEIKEVTYPGYKRIGVQRSSKGWKPFKGKEGTTVMVNVPQVYFPRINKIVLINYAGIVDYTGKLMCLAPTTAFMGQGYVYFGEGDLMIRVV